jgi:hypothetical protein
MSLLGVRGGWKYLLVDILAAVDINLSDVIGFGVAWWGVVVDCEDEWGENSTFIFRFR